MWWRSRKVWAAGLSLWALALLLPRPSGHPPGAAHWPPRTFCVYYGRWDSARIAQAHAYELIIAHPGKKLEAFNADLVSRLRSGADGLPGNDDDSLVLAYVSLGEDEDPPPGPVPMPARFLDRKRLLQKNGFLAMGEDGLPQEVEGSDGIPDRNGAWGSYYVHPMDPEWRGLLEQRLDQLARRGVDGFFLDTVDVQPDLQAEMVQLIQILHQRYPRLRWVANRGVELFKKQPAQMRSCLDAVVLESWFTQWNWSWGRAVVAPDRAENERLTPIFEGVTRLYLDYLDPQQPDRGQLLAVRAGHEPAFWSHPFLDRLETLPVLSAKPLPNPNFEVSRLADGRVQINPACEVAVEGIPLAGEEGPWAVGAARQLRLRRVDPQGNVSPSQFVDLAPRSDDWRAAWSVQELDQRVRVSWSGGELGQLWLGDQPQRIQPTDVQGHSPLTLSELKTDRLYWLAISFPGGSPDRVRPFRTHDVTPPASPSEVQARRHGSYLTVTWAPVKDRDLAGYRVYINRAGASLTLPYTRVAETNLEVKVPPEGLEIRVTSFDTGNHESQPAREITLPPP
ncbi:endo alpha-1,4 polygalactosaminidase [bacterium]|nr:endo alpha-1,4 polygalactosaminidase [bacterium]